eukprot:1437064-Amphidinium_carterae.1
MVDVKSAGASSETITPSQKQSYKQIEDVIPSPRSSAALAKEVSGELLRNKPNTVRYFHATPIRRNPDLATKDGG